MKNPCSIAHSRTGHWKPQGLNAYHLIQDWDPAPFQCACVHVHLKEVGEEGHCEISCLQHAGVLRSPPQGCGAHVADFYGLSGGHQQCRINPLTVATQAMRRLCLVTWGSRIPVLNQPMAAVGITHGSQTKFGWAFILTTNRFSWESVTGPRSPREINGWMEIWTQVCSFLVQHYNHNTTLALYSQVQSTHVDVHTVMSA